MRKQLFNNIEIVWNKVNKQVEIRVGKDVMEAHSASSRKEAKKLMGKLEEILYATCFGMGI